MFKNKLTVVILFLICNFSIAQQPSLAWAKAIGGLGYDGAYSITTDAQGNVYTTGNFTDTIDFDPGVNTNNLYGQSRSSFISKFDATGNFVWAKSLGNVASSYIAVDAAGNVYTTGYFIDTVDFDPGVDSFHLISNFDYNVFVLKLSTSGDFIWAKKLGTNVAIPFSLFVDDAAYVYISGSFAGTCDFDPGPGVYNLTNPSLQSYSMNTFISKLDTAGNFIWAKSFASDGKNQAYSINVDAAGNVYTTGDLDSITDVDPSPNVYNLTPHGYHDIFISKLDASGNFVWAKNIGGGVNFHSGNSIYTNAAGAVFVTGYFSGTIDFDPGPGTFNLTASGGTACFLLKLSASGDLVWVKNINGNGTVIAQSITGDGGGSLFTTGYFFNTIDFDPGPGVFNMTSAGSEDIFIYKVDSSGNLIWAKQFGSSMRDIGYSVCTDVQGSVYATGYFAGSVDFDPTASNYYLSSAGGSSDIFILKLSQTTLPLRLLTFTAKKENNTNLLNWKTANEINVSHFEIERSGNGREFSKIGTTRAGQTQYSFADEKPATNKANYYRLKMMDIDGQFTYSPVRMINYSSSFNVAIYPNPVKDNLQVQIEGDKNSGLQLLVLSADGKIMISKSITANENSSLQSINISTLSKGSYLLKVIGSNEEKVMKFEKL